MYECLFYNPRKNLSRHDLKINEAIFSIIIKNNLNNSFEMENPPPPQPSKRFERNSLCIDKILFQRI